MPNDNRVFPAGTGGNPTSPILGSADLLTAQPPIRPPPDPFVLKSVEPFTDDDNIPGFVDGAGDRIWHVDTSASAKAITFVSAGESTDFDFVVKWTKGTNALKILAAAGNVGGTLTFSCVAAGDAYWFRSDGIDYQLVGQVGAFVTSNSLSIALAAISFGGSQSFTNLTVTGSATFSQTVAFLTAASISGTLSVGTLVVAGTASFSATVVFAGVTIHNAQANFAATASFSVMPTFQGSPIGWVKLGSAALANTLVATFSGSWSAFTALRIEAFYLTAAATFDPAMGISSDNGTSYLLTGSALTPASGTITIGGSGTNASVTYSGATSFHVEMIAANITGAEKFVSGLQVSSNGKLQLSGTVLVTSAQNMTVALVLQHLESTATANSAFINQVSFFHRNAAGTTLTMSSGVVYLYGLV